jgi:translation elongation factor EF-Tu-like GTPase
LDAFSHIGNTTVMRQVLECCHGGWGVPVIARAMPRADGNRGFALMQPGISIIGVAII